MKIVEVLWLDAHGGNKSGWKKLRKIASTVPATGRSVGYLVKRTDDLVVVCPHLVGEGKSAEGDGEIAIPKSWVKKIRVLSNG